MRYSVLGRLLIDGDRAEARLPGRKERSVLAVLLAQHGSVTTEPDLVRALWGDQPPATASRSLASHVSRVRRVTGDSLRREGSGWVLDTAGALDSERLGQLVETCERAASDGAWVEALGLVTRARSLWRGPPFDGLTSLEPCAAEAHRLLLVRSRVDELTAECRLATGQGPELVDELRALVEAEPLREQRWSLLMTALFRAGRQADALRAYREARTLLRRELGIEPSAQLARTHARVLAADPTLLAQLTSTEPEGAPGPTGPSAPYPGLSSYGAEQAAVFLGRERVVARLLERLAESGRVTLAGASGSGKSSVLDAGVLPALRGGGIPGSETWRVCRWRVGDPVDEASWRDADLLVVDQLEEVFTLADPDARSRAAEELRARAAGGTRLLLALRSDFWSRCADEPALADLVADSSWLLSPLAADELRRVVVEPPRRLGVTVDPALAEAVVETVGSRDGVLPLLSTALERAWDAHTAEVVTLADYHRGGGIEEAVGRLAEEVWDRLDAPGRRTARAVLLRLTTDGPDGLVVGHRAPVAEVLALGPRADDVLEHLVAGRLVVSGERGVELVHEALLTGWPRFAGWLAEDAAARRLRRHLTPAAAEWERRGRRDEDLYTGARLAETSIVVEEHAEGEGDAPLAAREREFLKAAWRRDDAERMQALATAARDRRRVRQLRGLLAGALVLVVLAGLLTVTARRERDRAGAAERTAVAGAVGSAALLEPRPDLALLLAVQGYRLAPAPATASNLLGVVLRFPWLVHATNLGYRVVGTAVSPDGRYLATCSNRGGLYLLDPETLDVLRTLVPPDELACAQPAFSSDGSEVAATWQVEAEVGAELRVYDVSDGDLLAQEPARDGYFTVVSADGSRILTSAYLGSYLWRRTPDGWQRQRLGPRNADVRISEVGPAGVFALSVPGEPVTVRRSRDGAVVRRLPGTRGWQVGEDVTADGEVAVFEPLGRRIVLRDLGTGGAGLRIDTPGDLVFVQLADHDRLLVATDVNGGTTVWDRRTGRLRLSVQATSGGVSAEVAPDGHTLFLAGDDGTLLSADLSGTRGFGSDLSVPTGVVDAAYTGDGTSIVVATDAGNVVALDATTLDAVASADLGRGGAAEVAPGDGSTALVVADDAVTVVDTTRALAVLDRVEVDGAVAAAGSADGVLAVARSTEPALLLVGRDGTRRQVALPVAADRVAWSPDGSVVAAALTDSSVRLFTDEGSLLDVVPSTDDPVSVPVAFLDPTTLLLARRDGTLQSWDVSSGTYVGDPVPATGGRPTSLSVAGGLAVVGSAGAGVALVDPVAGVRYGGGLLPGGQEGLVGLLAPDLRTLTVLTTQGSARRWPASPAVWREHACEVASRSLTEVEWRRHVPGEDYDPAC